jgi:Type I phosphodiesterase / nucleotide pyrophosphatase
LTQPIPVPAFGGGSLADVLPAVLTGLGVPGEAAGLDLPVAPRVCVVLIDGLGWNALRARPDDAPYLTSLLGNDGSRAITSVFPTTTPIALTSLGTGLSPGEHGIVGLLLRLPEDGRVVDTLANPAQVDMRALQPRPTAFERADAAGVEVTRIGPRHFDGAGLSEAGLRGGRYAGAESVGERVDATYDAVRRGERSLAYVYLGTLDATGHRRGCTSAAWAHELTHIDRVVEQIATALPTGSALVVTSDHGMVDVPFENRWDVADTPALSAGVEVVAGDLRGVHVHARPGASADVLAAWRTTLGADFWVLSRDEAIEAGLYGTVLEHAYHRIGDVVALASDTSAVVDSRAMSSGLLALVGLHGSVTEDELVVPLLIQVTA